MAPGKETNPGRKRRRICWRCCCGPSCPTCRRTGCAQPNLKDRSLAEKYGGATPAETVKAMLLPGEIEDLSRAVERLCGYRGATIEEVKNA